MMSRLSGNNLKGLISRKPEATKDIRDGSPITNLTASARKDGKAGRRKSKNDPLASKSDHGLKPRTSFSDPLASKSDHGLKPRTSSSRDLGDLKYARKSFNDLLKTQKDQPVDYSVKVFTGRMIAKQNAWKDQASEKLPSSQSGSSSGNGPTKKTPKRSSSNKAKLKKLDKKDLDQIFNLVDSLKDKPDGEKLLHDLIKKQAKGATTHRDSDKPPVASITMPAAC